MLHGFMTLCGSYAFSCVVSLVYNLMFGHCLRCTQVLRRFTSVKAAMAAAPPSNWHSDATEFQVLPGCTHPNRAEDHRSRSWSL